MAVKSSPIGDVGQQEDLEAARKKALATGALRTR
jgi:argininosuccinate synthase